MFTVQAMSEKSFTQEFQQQATASMPTLFTHPESQESQSMMADLTRHEIPFLERSVIDQPSADELAATGAFMTPLLMVGEQGYTYRSL